MNSSNQVNSTGLLDETNFDEWLQRMRRILSVNFPGSRLEDNTYVCTISGEPAAEMSFEFATILWWQVKHHIRARIPRTSRECPSSLLKALHGATRPFRFLDLPPEFRTHVYSIILPSKVRLSVTFPRKSRLSAHRRKTPEERSLMSVNRQVRAETLPLYCRNAEVVLQWDKNHWCATTGSNDTATAAVVKSIHRWASAQRSDSLRLLRNLSLKRPRSGEGRLGMDMELSLKIGVDGDKLKLTAVRYPELSQSSRRILNRHAVAITGTAQSLNLKGEALVMFLTSRPGVWDSS